jgi:hypothetical protein
MNFPPKSPMYKQEIHEGTGNSGIALNVSHSSSSSSSSSSTTVKTQYSDEVTKSILRSAIHLTGKNYLTDISHAVSVLCRYFSCPTQELWTAAKRVLRYLRGSAKLGLTFNGGISGIGLEMTPCYSDSNWANDWISGNTIYNTYIRPHFTRNRPEL